MRPPDWHRRCVLRSIFRKSSHRFSVENATKPRHRGGVRRARRQARGRRRSQKLIDAAVRRLRAFGGEVVGLSADVRNVEAVAAALRATHDSLGDIDVLVSGASGDFPSTALGTSRRSARSHGDQAGPAAG
jgi:NAD(P)-dependent dehydrogenase (short-subunit alcohol dehydrogenase family)